MEYLVLAVNGQRWRGVCSRRRGVNVGFPQKATTQRRISGAVCSDAKLEGVGREESWRVSHSVTILDKRLRACFVPKVDEGCGAIKFPFLSEWRGSSIQVMIPFTPHGRNQYRGGGRKPPSAGLELRQEKGRTFVPRSYPNSAVINQNMRDAKASCTDRSMNKCYHPSNCFMKRLLPPCFFMKKLLPSSKFL